MRLTNFMIKLTTSNSKHKNRLTKSNKINKKINRKKDGLAFQRLKKFSPHRKIAIWTKMKVG